MKQLIQNSKTGELQMVEVPNPSGKSGLLVVQTMASLVSIGTEKAMIDVAKKSLLGKALARPDWVKQVIDKIKTEGLRVHGETAAPMLGLVLVWVWYGLTGPQFHPPAYQVPFVYYDIMPFSIVSGALPG